MSEMIERVARALDPYAFSVDVQPAKEGPLTVDDIWAERQFTARRRARDAIEAMREPTPSMLAAGWRVVHRFWGGVRPPHDGPGPGFKEAQAAMIDAALAETP
jgi:hypothetical protein